MLGNAETSVVPRTLKRLMKTTRIQISEVCRSGSLTTALTQWGLHRLCRYCECLSGCFHVQRLMWASLTVESDPVTDRSGCVLDAVEALAMHALLLQRPDHAFDHAGLLRAVRCISGS